MPHLSIRVSPIWEYSKMSCTPLLGFAFYWLLNSQGNTPMWNYTNTCGTRWLYLFIMLLIASETVGLIFLSTFVSIHLTTYLYFYRSTFIRFFSFPFICIYIYIYICFDEHAICTSSSALLSDTWTRNKRQPAPSCSISSCVLLSRSWTILNL